MRSVSHDAGVCARATNVHVGLGTRLDNAEMDILALEVPWPAPVVLCFGSGVQGVG
jgi:hypothetical protein